MKKIIKTGRIKLLILAVVLVTIYSGNLFPQMNSASGNQPVTLPNGWKLSPVGKLLPLGDLPLNIAISPNQKIAAVTNNGQSTQSVELIDIEKGILLDSIIIGKSWLGLTFSADGKYLYASGGNDNIIIKYSVANNHLSVSDTIILGKKWPVKISVAGIAVDDAKNMLYAVTKENNSLYAIDLKSKTILSRHPLGGEGYTCLLSPDHKILYITCWGCDKVLLFDTQLQKLSGSVAVGDNPKRYVYLQKWQILICCQCE